MYIDRFDFNWFIIMEQLHIQFEHINVKQTHLHIVLQHYTYFEIPAKY